MQIHFLNKNKGITLLETVIALGILTVGLISVLTLSTASIGLSQSSEQQIVVANLAREGIEIVREIRDYAKSGQVSSVFDNANIRFFDDGTHTVVPDGCYRVDSEDNFQLKIENQTVGTNCVLNNFDLDDCTNCGLYQDGTSKLYSHTSSDNETVFKRAVKIISTAEYEKRILSKVIWSERGREHEFLLETTLTDW